MILGDQIGEYFSSFARRAMADLAFKDRLGNYYVVDVKTHREGTAFNMPNLTSVDRLARFYEDDTNFFVAGRDRVGRDGGELVSAIAEVAGRGWLQKLHALVKDEEVVQAA